MITQNDNIDISVHTAGAGGAWRKGYPVHVQTADSGN
jgi:hypothetical protein